jgi:hypothetical protein
LQPLFVSPVPNDAYFLPLQLVVYRPAQHGVYLSAATDFFMQVIFVQTIFMQAISRQ